MYNISRHFEKLEEFFLLGCIYLVFVQCVYVSTYKENNFYNWLGQTITFGAIDYVVHSRMKLSNNVKTNKIVLTRLCYCELFVTCTSYNANHLWIMLC